jgi:hypothetical protein
MDTSEVYIRQLLVRAVAVGESIAVYSDQPALRFRWRKTAAVVERRRAPEFVVIDRPTASAIGRPFCDGDHAGRRGGAPDLRFVQTSDSAVRVTSSDPTMGCGDRGGSSQTGINGLSN